MFQVQVVNSSEWLKNNQMTNLYEAFVKISSESIYSSSKGILPEDILKNYIYTIDDYGDYFTKLEHKAFEDMLASDYAGVGMILYQQKRDDRILCIPMNKNLDSRGLSKYDELISVDGRLVRGKNFYLVSSWVRGVKNSRVRIQIKTTSGQLKSLLLTRKEQTFRSIQRVIENGVTMIRIVRFTSDTSKELQSILEQWAYNIPIVIDLRGNGGGDFFAAIKSADLLLPTKTLITSIETKKSRLDYFATNSDTSEGKKVVLLQDKFTASAAEVFISALTQNNRAESIGEKSFGKGVAQKFIPLNNGDALLLTYGEIITPNNKKYHKKGLVPTSHISLQNLSKLISQ